MRQHFRYKHTLAHTEQYVHAIYTLTHIFIRVECSIAFKRVSCCLDHTDKNQMDGSRAPVLIYNQFWFYLLFQQQHVYVVCVEVKLLVLFACKRPDSTKNGWMRL